MKGNEIIDNITSDIRAKMPDIEQVRANYLNQAVVKTGVINKNTRKRLMKPILVFAMCIIFITTAVAAAPMIFKMLGSNISFFNTDKQTRYSPYQETLKKYSTKVNITQEQNGISFTIDNIAVDDNFINIFYTIKSEYNLYEYIQEWFVKYDGGKTIESKWYSNTKYHDFALYQLTPILDYRLPGINGENSGNRNNFDSLDSYAVSDYEIKGAQKMLISEELPEIFDIEIFINAYNFHDHLAFVNIPLTIDRTATSVKTKNIYPNVSAVVSGKSFNSKYQDLIAHDITVEKISMSPLGNVIVFREEPGENTELFWDYVLMDDKGNYLERNYNGMRFRTWNPAGKESVARFAYEIYGIDENTEYLKLIPFIRINDYTWIDGVTKTETGEYYSDLFSAYADKDKLPVKLRHTNKSVLNIETIETVNDTVTITYTVEGVWGYDNMNFVFWPVYYDGVDLSDTPTQMMRHYYDAETKTHTQTIIIPGLAGDISDFVKGVSAQYYDIDLLEDEAVIIPLK